MIKAYKSYWENAFNFHGRTSRGGYWWVAFINIAIFIALVIFMYLSLSGAIDGFKNPIEPLGPVVPIIIVVSWPFINAVPSLAMTVRRLHDTGRSGANYFFALIPLAGPIIMVYFLISPTKDKRMNRYGYRRQV
ncbi:MAG: DUF805 domain-containing protein [Clostridiales bacterium]|nr:DUF805 domain-containing protein [Clostridiales bacterium]